jgi:flavin reductase
MRTTKRICINFLSAEDVELAELFSSASFKGSGRFDPAQWTDMASGVPALNSALAALDCEIIQEMTVGQHSVFICEIKAARLNPEKEPLVHFNREFCELLPIA